MRLLFIGLAVTSTSASIPSKYQTLVIDNSDNDGFLSKSKRFNYDLLAVAIYVMRFFEIVRE